MEKTTIGFLIVAAMAVGAIGLFGSHLGQTAHAATASTGAFADDSIGFASATGAASHNGGSGSAAGFSGNCPNFSASGGSCSESSP